MGLVEKVSYKENDVTTTIYYWCGIEYLKKISNKNSRKTYFLNICISNKNFDNYHKKMKLGVAYNLFDGEELLESSIKSIREEVDYICVVYQTKSYYGNLADSNLVEQLNLLKQNGLIDEIYYYEPNFKKKKIVLEREKRNIGLSLVKKAKCTHFLSLDVDEFYESKQIRYAKNFIIKNNISASAVSIYEYLKSPEYRLVENYVYAPTEPYNFYVPFIFKINSLFLQKHGSKFPTLVDPSRGIKFRGKFYLFPVQDVVMHHMSTVRKDLNIKYNNSNLNGDKDFSESKQELINEINNYDFEKNRIGETEFSRFQNKLIKKVDNKFGIEIN